jgi:hypothetical protein
VAIAGLRVPKGGSRVWILSAGSLAARAYIQLKGDVPKDMAFSPDGRFLAVECWYHIVVFRLEKPLRATFSARFAVPAAVVVRVPPALAGRGKRQAWW